MPLHIFEERYKRMIGHCLEAGEPFGIVFRDDDGGARLDRLHGPVTEVLERFDDGRLNVVVTGGARSGCSTASRPPRTRRRGRAGRRGEAERRRGRRDAAGGPRAFADLAERAAGERPTDERAGGGDAYEIAARVELPAGDQAGLLRDALARPSGWRCWRARCEAARSEAARARRGDRRAGADRTAGSARLRLRALRRRRPRRRGAGRRPRPAPRPGLARDGLDAAEEEVLSRPADDPCRAPRSAEPRLRRRPGSAWTVACLEVDPRRLDRRRGPEPVGEHADDRLQDRRADPVRAAAAEPGLSSPSRRTTVGDIIERHPRARGRAGGSRAG